MADFRCERILVPTDLSPFAEKAVRYAHGLAELCGAELHVLHVARDASELTHIASGVVEPGPPGDYHEEWLRTLLGEAGTVRRVESVRIHADVTEGIVAYAGKHQIDLVVMTTHGRSGLSHLLMGSIAERVLRAAPCPVLVIRPG
jgi:nucleotide-binding universal stress UspA family protein